jgi:hypothetical protein
METGAASVEGVATDGPGVAVASVHARSWFQLAIAAAERQQHCAGGPDAADAFDPARGQIRAFVPWDFRTCTRAEGLGRRASRNTIVDRCDGRHEVGR